jgi:hypothetical protein
MSNSIPLIDAQHRNCSLRYSVKGNSIFFTVTRFDGHPFRSPPFAKDALESELESTFIEIVDLFEGY